MKIGFLEGMAILIPMLQLWMWFRNRPAKCLVCGTRLTEKNGWCHRCGAKDGSHVIQSKPRGQAKKLSTRTKGAVAGYCGGSLALLVFMPWSQVNSAVAMILCVTLILGGMVWVMRLIMRDQACQACGQMVHGQYCSRCGHGIR